MQMIAAKLTLALGPRDEMFPAAVTSELSRGSAKELPIAHSALEGLPRSVLNGRNSLGRYHILFCNPHFWFRR